MRAMIPWRSNEELTPFSSLREVDRVFDSLWRGWGLEPVWRQPLAGFSPSMDIQESDAAYTVTAELPGIDQQDLELSLKDGVLTIRGEKKLERDENKDGLRYNERSYGSFMRTVTLGGNVREDAIDATHKNGVLTITLPKKDPNDGVRKIDVKGA